MTDSIAESDQAAEFDWAISPDVDAALDELEDASPRAAAVLGGALLEDLLDRLLSKALPEDSQAKLEALEIDYFHKGRWALRMGLISKFEFSELQILGRIRNQFAHSWSADLNFGSERIKDRIRNLKSPDHPIQEVSGSGKRLILQGDVTAYTQESDQHRWLIAINQMMIRLLGRVELAQKFSIPPDHDFGSKTPIGDD